MKKKRERERTEWGQDLCPREGAVIVKEERSPHWTGASFRASEESAATSFWKANQSVTHTPWQ